MKTKAVLFDAGDTLFRLRGSVGEVYAAIACRHGADRLPADLEARFRAAFRTSPPLCFPGVNAGEVEQRSYGWWRALVLRVFSEVRFPDFESFFRELYAYFAEAEAWQLFPDTLPCLEDLARRSLRLGVVSNFDSRLLRILGGLGLLERFEVLVFSARVGFAKPDARIFHHALERLELAPGAVVHVGDREREDVDGASAAGVRAFRIDRYPSASGLSVGVLSCLTELGVRLG